LPILQGLSEGQGSTTGFVQGILPWRAQVSSKNPGFVVACYFPPFCAAITVFWLKSATLPMTSLWQANIVRIFQE
jgi:hypothetical protein